MQTFSKANSLGMLKSVCKDLCNIWQTFPTYRYKEVCDPGYNFDGAGGGGGTGHFTQVIIQVFD